MCSAAQAGSPAAAASGWRRVGRVEDLRGVGPHAVSADGVDLVLVRTATGLRAFEGRCPHQGALLGEGELMAGTLICRNHRWRFSIDTGRRDRGGHCLAAFPVMERDGDVFVGVAAAARHQARGTSAQRQIADLPGPRGLPLAGNLFQLDIDRLHLILERWSDQFGPLYRFRIGRTDTVVISDPDLAETVLRGRPATFRRAATIETVFAELGVAGVFSAEGLAWRQQRRLAMRALSHRNLRGFYPVLAVVAERLRTRCTRLAESGESVDIVEELKRFTVDITTLLTFGYDVNTIERPHEDVMQRRLELITHTLNRRLFALVPTWRLVQLPRDRRVNKALSEIRAWLGKLIADARTRLQAEPERARDPRNFLEAMLAARDEAGLPFADDVIHGNLLTMLLAGEETTAFTLAWAVHHLCEHPAAVARLRREADRILGAAMCPPDIETADRLAYAGAVIEEVMRLRPVGPVLLHDAVAGTALGDVEVPAGTRLAVLVRPQVRQAARFADPAAFRPERWLEPIGAHEPSAHIPFGAGARICAGRSLALVTTKIVLAMLYRSFEIEHAGNAPAISERFAITMGPAGLVVRLRPRVKHPGCEFRTRPVKVNAPNL